MYKRYSSMAGDITMAAPRRLLAKTMAKYEQPVYSYRWDVAALNATNTIGVNHFAEVRCCEAGNVLTFSSAK
jgi:acetylcholinesterase